MTYFNNMQEALRREAAHAYNLTKEDRKTLIDWYIECLEEMGREIDETAEFLNQLGNPSLIYECMQFMPDCLEDLKRSKSL
jgi:hypothetical protein